MKENSIKIKNLKKIYNNRAVVSDVSIDLKRRGNPLSWT